MELRRVLTAEFDPTCQQTTQLQPSTQEPVPLTLPVRAHWGIENRLHYVRDVSMHEDRCRVRAGGRALSAIRNLVLSLIRARGQSVPEARENFREDRDEGAP